MKGLLIKDFMLLKSQKKFYITIAAIAVAMSVASRNAFTVISYLVVIMPLFAISTISYDEYENGYAFLFTLPVCRKDYVVEKYCFSLILGVMSTVVAFLISLVLGKVMNIPVDATALTATSVVFPIMLILNSVMLPVQLKFGSEKSRIALIAIGGISALVGFALFKILSFLNVDVFSIFGSVQRLSIGVIIAAAFVFAFIMLLLSMKISIKIMNKKEF